MLLFRNKSGVSVMIGYVLLIVGAVVMGGVIYGWLQSYVPQESLECPEGVSLFIKDIKCVQNGERYLLDLKISNNGRFDVDGYFIKAAYNENHTIATIDISKNLEQGGNANSGLVLFPGKALNPGLDAPLTVYNLPNATYLIELVPIRYEIIENKNRLITCGDAKIKEKVIC